MKRTELKRKSRLSNGQRKLMKRASRAIPKEKRGRATRFHDAAQAQWKCAVASPGRGAWHAHHVIEAQEVKRRGGDEWDPRNALRLSIRVHERHTLAVERVPLRCLTDTNVAFAFELMGTAAYVYLGRMYADHDERVELALAELEATHV